MKTTILPLITTKNRMETKFKAARGITGHLLSWAAMNRPPWRYGLFLTALALACFSLSPQARAVCQEGCGASGNTFLGDNALLRNPGGGFNTAVGNQALFTNANGGENCAFGDLALFANTASWNSAFGSQALANNTTGIENTATGRFALHTNTSGSENTANGARALSANGIGHHNTANGSGALQGNTSGSFNTANGVAALYFNMIGTNNCAFGYQALVHNTANDNSAFGSTALASNTDGTRNTAIGRVALFSNTRGSGNTAVGFEALLSNTTGYENTAIGDFALANMTTGQSNIALGFNAGSNLITGNNNIHIGAPGYNYDSGSIRIGVAQTQTQTFIAGIHGSPIAGANVVVNPFGRLGTVASSQRFKEAIKPMDKASEAILALKPVTFRYKKEIDEAGIPQFGLVAEEVEKVNPDLVARDEQGKPYTVRYEAVNAMLLNEFLKEHKAFVEEHRTVQDLKATVALQQKEIDALTAGLQKVSAHLELSKSAPKTAWNNR